MTTAQRNFRISKLTTTHVNALNTLSSTPQALPAIAPAYGATVDAAEKHLSLLIDEGLAFRTLGDRTKARYTLV